MPVVKYTNEEEVSWVVAIPEGGKAEYGAILGPPDLKPLGLSDNTTIQLQNMLVDNNLYNAPQLMGKRAILQRLLTELGLREYLRPLISLFQQEYYGDS